LKNENRETKRENKLLCDQINDFVENESRLIQLHDTEMRRIEHDVQTTFQRELWRSEVEWKDKVSLLELENKRLELKIKTLEKENTKCCCKKKGCMKEKEQHIAQRDDGKRRRLGIDANVLLGSETKTIDLENEQKLESEMQTLVGKQKNKVTDLKLKQVKYQQKGAHFEMKDKHNKILIKKDRSYIESPQGKIFEKEEEHARTHDTEWNTAAWTWNI